MKKTLLSIALALASAGAGASPRTAQEALDIARRFIADTPMLSNVSASRLTLASSATAQMAKGAATTTPSYYVYNIEDNGFVIVSGDDRFKEVLGYSLNGTFSDTDMPDGLRYWLSFLSDEMAAAIDAGYTPSATSSATSNVNVMQSVEPLIKTKWDQNNPYNNMLNGNMTGCVATGTAQVMNYWKYPTRGTGSHTGAYAPNFSADFSSTTYDWKNMLDVYGTGWETKAEVDAVATLMLHLGVATDMRWSKDQSGTVNHYAAHALRTYFNYNPNLYVESRDHMSLGAWKTLLINQLQTGHPLCYTGNSSKGGSAGHYFVCDGYDANTGKFHFNWGWSGVYDGYFEVTALEPGTGGIGAGLGEFNSGQMIIVNVQPEPTGEYVPHFDANTVTITTAQGKNVSITAANFANNNAKNISGSIGLAVYKADGTLYRYIPSDVTLPISGFHIGSYYGDNFKYNVNATDIPDGTYTTCAAFWNNDDSKAYPIRAFYSNTTYYAMTVKGGAVTFTAVSNQPVLEGSTVSIASSDEGKIYVNKPAQFNVTVANKSAIDFNDEIGIKVGASRSTYFTASVPAYIPAGETRTITVTCVVPANCPQNDNATATAGYVNNGTFESLNQTTKVSIRPEGEWVAGIEGIVLNGNQSSAAYNVAGQRVGSDAKGIVILNGKKTIK